MRYLLAVLLSCLFVFDASAQIGMPVPDPLLITLDHNDDFVLTGIGQQVVGINFMGPVGTFEPAIGSALTRDPETGELTGEAPAPFDFMLIGRSDWVSYGLLSPGVELNGSFPLQFGPSDLSLIDEITIEAGFGGVVVPVSNPFSFICDTCNYPSAIFNPDGGIEVTNINDPIIRVTVFSNDGGLISVTEVPAGVSVVSSTETEVTLEKLDGFDVDTLQSLDFLSGVSSSQPVFVKFGLEDGIDFGPLQMPRAVPEPTGAVPLVIGAFLCSCFLRRRRSQA